MESDPFIVPMGMACQNPIIGDTIFSTATSVSLTHPNFFDLNHQNHVMAGFPMLQGEPMTNVEEGLHLANGAEVTNPERNATSIGCSIPISNTNFPVSATALATLLAARYSADENLNNIEASAPTYESVEVPKSVVSNNLPCTFQSPFLTSENFGFDGMIGDMSSRWDFNNFFAPTEILGNLPGRTEFQPHSNEWILSENASVSSDSPSGSSRFSNELSLSLATCSEMSCSGVSNLSLHERRLGFEQASCNSKNLSLRPGSNKPIQVLQLLSGSGYLRVMEEILAEIASYSLGNLDQKTYSFSSSRTAGRSYKQKGGSGGNDRFDAQIDPVLRGREVEAKKMHLLALLQVVDDRYNQCLDEIHTVVSAFHAVTEFDPQIHACFALQTISFFYKSLRDRISNHILAMGAAHFNGRGGARKEDERSFGASFIQKQWALQQVKRKDHQLWRPQRGLPEKSVSVLRAWMFQNFLHPYPKDAEKQLLAVKSGLSRSQGIFEQMTQFIPDFDDKLYSVELVYKCSCSFVEAHDRGNVRRDEQERCSG